MRAKDLPSALAILLPQANACGWRLSLRTLEPPDIQRISPRLLFGTARGVYLKQCYGTATSIDTMLAAGTHGPRGRMINALAGGASLLPEEVLRAIFENLASDGALQVQRLSHVCWLWRCVALKCPSLWTMINGDKHATPALRRFFLRAAHKPIYLTVSSRRPSVEVLFERFASTTSQVRTIRFTYAARDGLLGMSSLLADGRVFPRLDTLQIISDCSSDGCVPLFEEATIPGFPMLSGDKFPKLKHLLVEDLAPISYSTGFSGVEPHICKTLETLALSYVTFPLRSLEDLLANCPSLTGASFAWCKHATGDWSTSRSGDPTALLPRLKLLRFEYCSGSFVGKFFRIATAPLLKDLRVFMLTRAPQQSTQTGLQDLAHAHRDQFAAVFRMFVSTTKT